MACVSGCSGVFGFKVATWLCHAREKVRPAWPDGGCEREKVRPASPKRPKNAVFRRVGRVFSRVSRWRSRAGRTFSRKSRWKPRAGRIFRGPAVAGIPPGELCREGPERPRRWVSLWHLDVGLAPPLGLGHVIDPRCRARAAPRSRAHLPVWSPVGASGRRLLTAFPRDSSRFNENDSDP